MALTDNLISYWKLDEASGNALDAHGTNELTQNGTVSSQTGKLGNARGAFSTSNYFSITNNSSLEVGDIDFTVACWAYLTSKPSPMLVSRNSGGVPVYSLQYDWSQDRFWFRVYDAITTPQNVWTWGAGSVSLNTWYHIVAWHDAVNNQIGISANAGTPDTQSHSVGVTTASANTYIGYSAWDGTAFTAGYIDEVGFWKRVLTSQERADLYNGGSGLAYSEFGGGGGGRRRRPRGGETLGLRLWQECRLV